MGAITELCWIGVGLGNIVATKPLILCEAGPEMMFDSVRIVVIRIMSDEEGV